MRFFVILTLSIGLAVANTIPRDTLGSNSDESVIPKIKNGTPAKKYEFPYQLRILVVTGTDTFQCGGSIINDNYALAAAHCFYPPSVDNLTIQVGYTDVNNKTGGEYEINGGTITIHENYDPKTHENDIALVKVSEPFKHTKSSAKLPLIEKGSNPTGNAILAGWGQTKDDGPASTVLMKATIPVLRNASCHLWYSTYKPETMLCAGYITGIRDACEGDSGGPLVLNGTQVGIVSFGNGCGSVGYPGIYTRVSAFRDWIDKNAV